MDNMVKSLVVGVGVVIVSTLALASGDLYQEIKDNTRFRESSVEVFEMVNENHEILVRLEANQKFLLQKYDRDIE